MYDLATALGLVLGVTSVLLSVVQTIRVRRLTDEHSVLVWRQIADVKAMMRHLERGDVCQAYGLVNPQFRDLLRQAILLESRPTVETIAQWRRAGKLSSAWQVRQAMMMLPTRALRAAGAVDEALAHSDEVSDDNPVARRLHPPTLSIVADEETAGDDDGAADDGAADGGSA